VPRHRRDWRDEDTRSRRRAAARSCASSPASARLPAQVALDVATRTSDVVFYGEAHDDRRQHDYEAELVGEIAAAAPKGAPILVGMEMFQRPFQEPLDDTWPADRREGDAPPHRVLQALELRLHVYGADLALVPRARRARRRAERGGVALAQGRTRGARGADADERSQLAADIDLANSPTTSGSWPRSTGARTRCP